MRGVKQPIAGAFGARREVYSPEEDRLAEAKRAVRDEISILYSYAQIQDFAARHQRDVERRREIDELFAEAQGETLESLCFAVHLFRNAKRAKVRVLDHAARARKSKAFNLRYRNDPAFRAECIARTRRTYRRLRSDPTLWAAVKRRSAAFVKRFWRANPEAMRARWRKYWHSYRAKLTQCPERYARIRERERAYQKRRVRGDRSREWTAARQQRASVACYRGALTDQMVPAAYASGCSVQEIAYVLRRDVHHVIALLADTPKRKARRTDAEVERSRAFLASLSIRGIR